MDLEEIKQDIYNGIWEVRHYEIVCQLIAELEAVTKDRDMWLEDDGKMNNAVGRLMAENERLKTELEAAQKELAEVDRHNSEFVHIIEDANRAEVALRAELEAARRELSEAASEINCAGSVTHRIRILKKETSAENERLKAELEEARMALSQWKTGCAMNGVCRQAELEEKK